MFEGRRAAVFEVAVLIAETCRCARYVGAKPDDDVRMLPERCNSILLAEDDMDAAIALGDRILVPASGRRSSV